MWSRVAIAARRMNALAAARRPEARVRVSRHYRRGTSGSTSAPRWTSSSFRPPGALYLFGQARAAACEARDVLLRDGRSRRIVTVLPRPRRTLEKASGDEDEVAAFGAIRITRSNAAGDAWAYPVRRKQYAVGANVACSAACGPRPVGVQRVEHVSRSLKCSACLSGESFSRVFPRPARVSTLHLGRDLISPSRPRPPQAARAVLLVDLRRRVTPACGPLNHADQRPPRCVVVVSLCTGTSSTTLTRTMTSPRPC